MNRDYSDIIQLNRPVSTKHLPMDRMMRAAQFAPFAALSGHEEAVRETARLTDEELELDEYEIAALDRKLQYLKENCGTDTPGIEATITHFIEDEKKKGGAYVRDTGIVKKIDEYNHTLVLSYEKTEILINISKIIEILI